MGSVKHPSDPASYRPLEPGMVEALEAAFHEIYAQVQGQHLVRLYASTDELKAQIMARLLDLAHDGTLPKDFKSKVLSSLPPRG
jgi:hypothetical protein